MRRLTRGWSVCCTIGLFAFIATPTRGNVVLLGSDYLHSLPGTTFSGVPFTGVPIGPGNTDTIVQRQSNASLPALNTSDSIPTLMTNLDLVSAVPANFGLGVDFYYITLQSARGGPASTGRMTINWLAADDHLPNTLEGTFDSFFDVFFDVRKGAVNGPIALSNNLTLTSSGAPWDADPPPGAVIVPGLVGDQAANLHPNRAVGQMDFFPFQMTESDSTSGFLHVVNLSTPEPSAVLLLALGGGLLIVGRRPWAGRLLGGRV